MVHDAAVGRRAVQIGIRRVRPFVGDLGCARLLPFGRQRRKFPVRRVDDQRRPAGGLPAVPPELVVGAGIARSRRGVLLLLALISLLRSWASTVAPNLDVVFDLLRAAIWIWMPVYLFLMQKRVYRQGWFFTTLKFSLIGIFYTVIVSIGLIGALLATLALA